MHGRGSDDVSTSRLDIHAGILRAERILFRAGTFDALEVVVLAAAAGRILIAASVIILGVLALITPNGTLLITGGIILGVVYILTKSGAGSVEISVHHGGDGDVNISL